MNIIEHLNGLAEWADQYDRSLCQAIQDAANNLAASGALVPVPDGEKSSGFLICVGDLLVCEHHGVWQKTGRHYDKDWYMQIRNLSTGEETELLHSAMVQPVRLVPLEEFD